MLSILGCFPIIFIFNFTIPLLINHNIIRKIWLIKIGFFSDLFPLLVSYHHHLHQKSHIFADLFSQFFHPSSSNYKTIIILKKIFCDNCCFTMATDYLTSSQLNYFDSLIMTSIQQLKRWKKGVHLDNIYKEIIKTSDFVLA